MVLRSETIFEISANFRAVNVARCSSCFGSGRASKASAMEGAEAMTAEALQAKIAATRQRRQEAEARHRVLAAETAEALERQRLRAELEHERAELAQQELENGKQVTWRRFVDADRLIAGVQPLGLRCKKVGLAQVNSGQSSSFGHAVARGEYVWELRQFSWLRSALEQQRDDFACSDVFKVGAYAFLFAYSPEGGILPGSNSRGTLAIFSAEESRMLLRYRVFVKGHGGDFAQFGETCDKSTVPIWLPTAPICSLGIATLRRKESLA